VMGHGWPEIVRGDFDWVWEVGPASETMFVGDGAYARPRTGGDRQPRAALRNLSCQKNDNGYVRRN
jgi:hypothetical protein